MYHDTTFIRSHVILDLIEVLALCFTYKSQHRVDKCATLSMKCCLNPAVNFLTLTRFFPCNFCCFPARESSQHNECVRVRHTIFLIFFSIHYESEHCNSGGSSRSTTSGAILILILQTFQSLWKDLRLLNLLNHPIISPNLFKIGRSNTNHVSRVDVEGGGIEHVNSLKAMQLSDPAKNWQMYSNWADSVRSFPKVIKQQVSTSKISPLVEL